MTITNPTEAVEVIRSTQKRRRWTGVEKRAIMEKTYQAKESVAVAQELSIFIDKHL